MSSIHNPILRGFNPDPSIIRVGADYYIATSTFEWFPGVQIHHSTDLVHWELIAHPLNRLSQLDMRGNPDSCGVWAPCLSYDQGIFYLVYTNVRSFDGLWKDTPNFIVYTEDIRGDWSEPIFLNSSGFDPSLFHDTNGRKWICNMLVDHRRGKFFGGIVLQELDWEKKQMIGPVYPIFPGSDLGITEAPHLYQRNGYYYLLTAEGGTEYAHAVSLARSKSITGPYEIHPDNPVMTTIDDELAILQKTGHGDLVESPEGDWYLVFLTGRPLTQRGRCVLGRETAIETVEWRDDDWLYLKSGQKTARVVVPLTYEKEATPPGTTKGRDDFDRETLDLHFQSLRVPITEDWLSLKVRPGYLRLVGRESLSSFHHQSLIARRLQAFRARASTCIAFQPRSFQQMAGLVCYYNTAHFYYLHLMGKDETPATCLQIISCDNFKMTEVLEEAIDLPYGQNVMLRAEINRGALQFYYAIVEEEWCSVGPVLDLSILSDDYVQNGSDRYRPAFTGCFVGLCCQDLSGRKIVADFDWWEYEEIP
ncbi:MAG: glycoside hydrolase family 43 protein [Bacteroidota bacterium]